MLFRSIANTCLTCHKQSEKEFKDIVQEKLDRKDQLNVIAMDNLAAAHLTAKKAWEVGATDAEMAPVLATIRSAQWLWDYSIASHGSFFHAPGETLRLLGVAGSKAQEARITLAGILANYGVINYQIPDISTKELAQQVAGVPFEKLVKAKLDFKKGLMQEWITDAKEDGRLTSTFVEDLPVKSAYPQN